MKSIKTKTYSSLTGNISLFSDNCYAKKTIIHILDNSINLIDKKQNLSIFTFEKERITDEEFMRIIECDSDRILVLCHKNLIKFMSALEFKNKISFAHYDMKVKTIMSTLKFFLSPTILSEFNFSNKLIKEKELSKNERRTVSLYAKGASITTMSKVMNLNHKTIYSHKRNAMKKMGCTNNIDFMQKILKIRLVYPGVCQEFRVNAHTEH